MIPDFTAYMVPPWNFALGGIFFAQMLEKFYETHAAKIRWLQF